MTVIAFTPQEEQVRGMRTRRMLTWFLIIAIVMFFAGLTSAYVVSMSSVEYWTHFSVPKAFYWSTTFIVLGSIVLQLALVSAKKGQARMITPMLAAALVLGVGFSWFQFQGWNELADRKLNLVSQVLLAKGTYGTDLTIARNGITLVKEGEFYYLPDDVQKVKPLNAEMEEQGNAASSYFHVLTRAHWAHVAGGLVALLVMITMALRGRYTQQDHVGLWSGVIYWHFLGGLWIYLLLFLVFVH